MVFVKIQDSDIAILGALCRAAIESRAYQVTELVKVVDSQLLQSLLRGEAALLSAAPELVTRLESLACTPLTVQPATVDTARVVSLLEEARAVADPSERDLAVSIASKALNELTACREEQERLLAATRRFQRAGLQLEAVFLLAIVSSALGVRSSHDLNAVVVGAEALLHVALHGTPIGPLLSAVKALHTVLNARDQDLHAADRVLTELEARLLALTEWTNAAKDSLAEA